MKRQHRGMAVVEPKLTQKEIERRKTKLAKAVPPKSLSSQTKLLLALGSFTNNLAQLWSMGIGFGDGLKLINGAVEAQLRAEGYTGKIEFPYGKETPPQLIKQWKAEDAKRESARAAFIKKYKLQATKCLGKSRKKCPKCERQKVKIWPGALNEKYLLCSHCGWTDRRSAFDVSEISSDTLAGKVKEVLGRNFPGSSIDIKPGFRDNIHVTVTTNQFAGRTESQRTEMLWKAIRDKGLTNAERSKISLLTAQTCFERENAGK
jgi:ribosomal protein L37AE/L43A